MASDFVNNPIRVEAADAGTTVRRTRNLYVTGIVWDPGAAGADGNRAIIQDKAGAEKWSHTIRTGDLVHPGFEPTRPFALNGLVVPTLAAGVLFIYWQETLNVG
jgi:hypothetical protein